MKIIKFLIKSAQLLILCLLVSWLFQTLKISGSYIFNHVTTQSFGQVVAGVVKDVRPNPEINLSQNYIAHVSYPGPSGESLESDFRYAESMIKGSPNVTVFYRNRDPSTAILREDAGYFTGTMWGITFFVCIFTLLLVPLFFLERMLFKRKESNII